MPPPPPTPLLRTQGSASNGSQMAGLFFGGEGAGGNYATGRDGGNAEVQRENAGHCGNYVVILISRKSWKSWPKTRNRNINESKSCHTIVIPYPPHNVPGDEAAKRKITRGFSPHLVPPTRMYLPAGFEPKRWRYNVVGVFETKKFKWPHPHKWDSPKGQQGFKGNFPLWNPIIP